MIKQLMRPFLNRFSPPLNERDWYPFLCKHPLRFHRDRRRVMRRQYSKLEFPENQQHLDELIENGVVVIKDFVERSMVNTLREKVFPAAERIRCGDVPASWDAPVWKDCGVYRLRKIENVIPETRVFTDSPQILDIVNAYIGAGCKRLNSYVDYKSDVGKHDGAVLPHMDNWQPQIKAFLLLTDVTDDNAPMVYWRGSHKDGRWRWLFDYFFYTGHKYLITGVVPVIEWFENEQPPNRFPRMTLTAPAGSLILADVRGIHRGNTLMSGHRLQLVSKFRRAA